MVISIVGDSMTETSFNHKGITLLTKKINAQKINAQKKLMHKKRKTDKLG